MKNPIDNTVRQSKIKKLYQRPQVVELHGNDTEGKLFSSPTEFSPTLGPS